ncbi:hypothetical protein [Mesorhizobium australicum]|uniref:CD-NTase-associated protein 15 domain-containing protein n=1 Tax=Mesorhizobium australicum TaxID=536018 RepID=A0A1X7N0V1_9HYPH|nr:hypothetical protein [Mesorhizobium australicum]SMH30263.1 hypothetical protein SAMN02982922_1021 [Mesorhizobium australicum]
MYQALEKPTLIRIVLAIGALALIAAWLVIRPTDMTGYARTVSFAITGAAAFIMILGTSPLWRVFWKIFPFLNTWVFPNISGEWAFIAESNIKEIAAFHPDLDPAKVKVRIRGTMTIRQSLFAISMSLTGDGDYSMSDTLFVKPIKEAGTGRFYVTSVFRNSTPHPQPSDEQMHMGAAYIEILATRHPPEMKGVYWTNRNWQKGMNTAGTIKLTRASPKRGGA